VYIDQIPPDPVVGVLTRQAASTSIYVEFHHKLACSLIDYDALKNSASKTRKTQSFITTVRRG